MASATTTMEGISAPVLQSTGPSPDASRPEAGTEGGSYPSYRGLPLFRLNLEQYHRIAEHGIIDPKARAFLLDGVLVKKMTVHPPHIMATNNLIDEFSRVISREWHVSIQNPICLPDSASEPEPDAILIRGRPSDYPDRVAGPADIGLVVEVAESSLRVDQTTMRSVYAAAGIVVYWIVNLVANRIEVYTDPTGPDTSPDYRRRDDFGPDDSVPLVLDGREVARLAVRDILPPPPKA